MSRGATSPIMPIAPPQPVPDLASARRLSTPCLRLLPSFPPCTSVDCVGLCGQPLFGCRQPLFGCPDRLGARLGSGPLLDMAWRALPKCTRASGAPSARHRRATAHRIPSAMCVRVRPSVRPSVRARARVCVRVCVCVCVCLCACVRSPMRRRVRSHQTACRCAACGYWEPARSIRPRRDVVYRTVRVCVCMASAARCAVWPTRAHGDPSGPLRRAACARR